MDSNRINTRRANGVTNAQAGGAIKGVLIALAAVGVVIGLAAMGAMWGWNQVVNFPDDAREETVLRDHSKLISQVNLVVAAEPSLFQAAAALETLALPDDLLYLAIVRKKQRAIDADDKTEIIKRISWSGYSQMILGDTGYAELNVAGTTRHVLVIQQDIDNKAIGDYWIAYVPRPSPPVEQTASR